MSPATSRLTGRPAGRPVELDALEPGGQAGRRRDLHAALRLHDDPQRVRRQQHVRQAQTRCAAADPGLADAHAVHPPGAETAHHAHLRDTRGLTRRHGRRVQRHHAARPHAGVAQVVRRVDRAPVDVDADAGGERRVRCSPSTPSQAGTSASTASDGAASTSTGTERPLRPSATVTLKRTSPSPARSPAQYGPPHRHGSGVRPRCEQRLLQRPDDRPLLASRQGSP
nr:hypothetical protein [Angustibacter aerolatus]